MTSPTTRRTRPSPLVVLLVVAMLAAACGSDLDLDGLAGDSSQDAGAAESPEMTDGGDLPDSVVLGLRDLMIVSPDDVDALFAYQNLNHAIASTIAQSTDPGAVVAAVDSAVLASYEGPATAAVAAAIDEALAGQAIEVIHSDPKQLERRVDTTGSVDDPRLKVYFVNGVDNTLDFARGTTARLVQSLGHDVTHFYNPSAFNPADYTEAWCARSIEAFFAEQRQSMVLAQLQADEEAADAIARAAENGSLAWFYEAVTRSIDGVSRDVDAAFGGAALSGTELALARACIEIDEVKEMLRKPAEIGEFLIEWLDNTYEVVKDRVATAVDFPSRFPSELVELIKTDISQGRRVVVVGHSHGTLMARLALQEINRWYTEEWLRDCAAGSSPDAPAVAPIAVLYVSPAFTVDVDSTQAAVMVEGDFLSSVGGNRPTVEASGSQIEAGIIDRHDLRRYLEPGTVTLAHIQDAFTQLASHVLGIPGTTEACDDTGDSAPAAPEPAISDDPRWVLAETVVNPDGSAPHPAWGDLDVSPGELSWVFDNGDSSFVAAYYVTYELPPDELEPGGRYEIPVSVSGLIVTGEDQRFTAGEAILYINRGWDGSVGVHQNCEERNGTLECDEPAVNSGTLPFTAPAGDDTFEFNMDVLNCGACEVTFRYELR